MELYATRCARGSNFRPVWHLAGSAAFPGKPVYNTGLALTIRGELRTDLFEIALRETIAESPGLQLPPRSVPVLFDLSVLDSREKKDSLVAAQHWMKLRCDARYRWMIPRYSGSRSYRSASITRFGFKNTIT